MTCFGLKSGQDLKNRVAHSHQEFPGVPPPPPQEICIFRFEIWLKIENQMLVNTDTET